MFFKQTYKLFIISIICGFYSFNNKGFSQISISPGSTITENFTIGTSATATMPANWKADKLSTVRTVGTYASAATATEQRAGNSMSSSATNGIYNYAAGDPTTSVERAVGGISSGSASKSVNIYSYLQNVSASSIISFNISYDVEKYREGSNAAGFSIQLYFSTDGIAWTSAGSDFLTSFASDVTNNGYLSAPGTTVPVNSNLTLAIAPGSPVYFAWNYSVTSTTTTSNAQGLGIDNVSITANGSSNSITTGIVSAPPFNVTCIASASGTVAFTSTGTFTGNTYTAQLSNSSGSFALPTNIGTLLSDANSGTINITIPPSMPTGVGYQIRVVSSAPGAVGSPSGTFTINLTGGPCSAFEIQSILVDACGTPEGGNEMVRFKVGALPLNTSNLTVSWPNNSWLGLCQNATTTAIVVAINATITGGGSLIEPVGGVLPANVEVMLFTSTAFTYTSFDFSTLNYTIYAIFQCPGNTAGHFVNYNSTPGTFRTLTMTFTGFGTDFVTYDAHLVYNGDGGAVDFDPPGNPTYGSTGGCYPPTMPLPIELISFDAKPKKENVDLSWITSSETNNDYFTVERSANAITFESVLTLAGAGNSNTMLEYKSVDKNPLTGLSYYRLKQTDFDGKYTFSNIVPVVFAQSGTLEILNTYSDNSTIYLQILSGNFSVLKIEVLNMIGQTISLSNTESEEGIKSFTMNKENISKGLYFIRVTNDSYSVCRKVSL